MDTFGGHKANPMVIIPPIYSNQKAYTAWYRLIGGSEGIRTLVPIAR